MLDLLPARRSSRWLIWFLVYGLAVTAVFWMNRFVVLDHTFEWEFALRFMLLSFILALIVSGLGWLGARWMWAITSVGILGGFILMYMYSGDMTGWEDLASLAAFFMAVIIGLGLGLLVEGAVAIRKAYLQKKMN